MKVTDELRSALSYGGVIVLGPVVPLVIYLSARHGSEFVRQNAVQALNVALTWLLYGVSGAWAAFCLTNSEPCRALR